MAHSDVRDINLISDRDCKSCFFRLLRWLLKRNKYSPRKTIGDDVTLSPWQLSSSTSMSDISTRQHLSDARPPPEKRRWQFLSLKVLVLICSLGWSFGRGHVVALKVRTLDIWPCAVKRQTHVPVERLAKEICVKETIYWITWTLHLNSFCLGLKSVPQCSIRDSEVLRLAPKKKNNTSGLQTISKLVSRTVSVTLYTRFPSTLIDGSSLGGVNLARPHPGALIQDGRQ